MSYRHYIYMAVLVFYSIWPMCIGEYLVSCLLNFHHISFVFFYICSAFHFERKTLVWCFLLFLRLFHFSYSLSFFPIDMECLHSFYLLGCCSHINTLGCIHTNIVRLYVDAKLWTSHSKAQSMPSAQHFCLAS